MQNWSKYWFWDHSRRKPEKICKNLISRIFPYFNILISLGRPGLCGQQIWIESRFIFKFTRMLFLKFEIENLREQLTGRTVCHLLDWYLSSTGTLRPFNSWKKPCLCWMDIILGAEHFSQIFQVKQDLMKKPVFKRIIRNVKLLSGKCLLNRV